VRELSEVIVIAAESCAGAIAHRTQINQKLFNRGIHLPHRTAGHAPSRPDIKKLTRSQQTESHIYFAGGAQELAVPTGFGNGCAPEFSGRAASQSQPSLIQVLAAPSLPRFSTMNAGAHFGHGSGIGKCGVVKSHSGYVLHP